MVHAEDACAKAIAVVWKKDEFVSSCTREAHSSSTYIRVAERDVDLLDTLGVSGSLGVAMQNHGWCTGLARKNLDILHCRRRTLGRNTERLEHGLLPYPARSEGRSG